MEVGIRELKARLSELVDRASKGERIRVTKRGKPAAELRPAADGDGDEDRIAQGIAEGWIRPGSGRMPSLRRHGFKASRTVQELMDEDRGD